MRKALFELFMLAFSFLPAVQIGIGSAEAVAFGHSWVLIIYALLGVGCCIPAISWGGSFKETIREVRSERRIIREKRDTQAGDISLAVDVEGGGLTEVGHG